MPFLKQPIIWLILVFVLYAGVQLLWAYDVQRQWLLIEIYLKFVIAMWLIYRCIETEEHVKLFLWSYVGGCSYLAWLAYSAHTGGRFDSFGGAGFGDANSGALTMVTASFFAGSLILLSGWWGRLVLIGMAPLLVNAMIMTISRSAFLAAAFGGALFNLFTPKRYRWPVLALSLAGLLAFLVLTNESYWNRIASISYRGQEVQGVDTGSSRMEIMRAQVRMFRNRPLGCGHFCTDYLSPSYLDARYLDHGARSSHNSFLSFLVDQGVVGGAFYVAVLAWMVVALRSLAHSLHGSSGVLQKVFPALAACCGVLLVGDMFVPYVRYEPRFWFIALILVMQKVATQGKTTAETNSVAPGQPRRHA